MVWWLIISTPQGKHVWQIGDPDDTIKDTIVTAARQLVGVPPGNVGTLGGQGFLVQLTMGEPSAVLASRTTTQHLVQDLPADVTAYRAAAADANRAGEVASAKQVLAGLDAQGQAQVLANVPPPRK